MKKLLFFTVVIGFFVSLNAQETQKIVMPHSVSQDMLKVMGRVPFVPKEPTFLNNPELKKIQKRDSVVNYGYVGTIASQEFAVNTLEGGPYEWGGKNVLLFPDSLVRRFYYRVDRPDESSFGQIFHAVGFVFDPYSQTFGNELNCGLFEDNNEKGVLYGYKIDTVVVRGEYRRTPNYTGNDDTLRLFLSYHDVYPRYGYKGTGNSSEYIVNRWSDTVTYGSIRFLNPKVKYTLPIPTQGSACIPDAASLKTVDYILKASDVWKDANGNDLPKGNVGTMSFNIGLDKHFEVPAGYVVSVIAKFIPGYSYSDGDTIRITHINNSLPDGDPLKYPVDTVLKNTFHISCYNEPSTTEGFYSLTDHGDGVNGRLAEDIDVRYTTNSRWNGGYAYGWYLFPIIYLNLYQADYSDTIHMPRPNGIVSVTDVVSAVYPNPATSELTIRLKEAGQADVAIYNILGQKVQQTTLYDVQNTVSVADLSAGLYVLKVTQNGRIHTIKVTKK
jgi:hypothetical protein